MPKELTVAFLPVYPNPYQHLLQDALQQLDINIEPLQGMPSMVWLRDQRQRVRIMHLHWLSGLYMRRYLTPIRLAGFVGRLLMAERFGYRIVWTGHNILPHYSPFTPMHQFVRRLVMARADAVIVHCHYGREELLRRFPRRKPVYIVPLGSFAGVFPLTVNRDEARAKLGLRSGQFTYLFLGNISRPKGLEPFLDVFRANAAESDIVIIAGRNRDAALVKRLEIAALGDKRVMIHAGFIPNDEIQYYLLSADVMVAPFSSILTSSSVITGLSYGLPVIVPDLGCLPELVTPEAGIIYKAEDPESLGRALNDIKGRNLVEMAAAAKAISNGLPWEGIARQTADIYRTVIG